MAPKGIAQAAWDKAQECLKTAPEKWTSYISAGSFIKANGKLCKTCWTGSVCHSFMLWYNEDDLPDVFFNTMTHRKTHGGVPEDVYKAYVKWFCEESPFRNFILNEDIETAYEGGVLIDAKAAGFKNVLFICKALRVLYEDQWRAPVWKDLVDRGVHPTLALIVSQCVRKDLRDYGQTTHNTCVLPPNKKEDFDLIFADHVPNNGNGDYTKEVFSDKVDKKNMYYGGWTKHLLPISKPGGKKVKVPDGWGGYIEKEEPVSADSLAEDLKQLEKEYRK